MTDQYPKLLEEQRGQSMSPERTQSEVTAMELAPKAVPEQLQVPPMETLGSEEFLHERASTLRGGWFNKAKALAARAQAFIESIEYGGYQLPSAETRFNGTADGGEEGRPIVTHDYVADRTMDKTLNHYGSGAEQDSDTSNDADIAKIAGHGVTMLPAVRTSGLMALHGVAGDRMTVSTSPVTSMKR